jgi:hypothetical protein
MSSRFFPQIKFFFVTDDLYSRTGKREHWEHAAGAHATLRDPSRLEGLEQVLRRYFRVSKSSTIPECRAGYGVLAANPFPKLGRWV